MKKLLIMFLVLGMASLAQAAVLELSIDGSKDGAGNTTEITIDICTTITIDVYCNTAAPAGDTFFLAIVAGTGDGEWDGPSVIYAVMGNAGTLTEYTSDLWEGKTNVYDPETPPGVGKWCELDFHCTDKGDVTIYLTDHTGYVAEDAILVHQIPEPITIALLGLGGLFLRRRK